jgi:hypothetical protein
MKNTLTRYDPVRYDPERVSMEPRQDGDFVALDEIEPLLEAKDAEIAALRQDKKDVLEALEGIMAWQVKHVDKWENSAYDEAAKVVEAMAQAVL